VHSANPSSEASYAVVVFQTYSTCSCPRGVEGSECKHRSAVKVYEGGFSRAQGGVRPIRPREKAPSNGGEYAVYRPGLAAIKKPGRKEGASRSNAKRQKLARLRADQN
jgi:hypothetical protein